MSTLDPTFRNYSQQQAASYAAHRGSYSASILDHIMHYHHITGNDCFDVMLDIGCGAGNATRDLAKHFDKATGIDPGAEMIKQATNLGGQTKSHRRIEYEVSGAEQLDGLKSVQAGSIDLISSAMAAHWFRMEEFWLQAAKMLKPGGSVALWTQSSLYCHPSTPNAAGVQHALSHLEDVILGPYELPSNRTSRVMYENLQLPWDLAQPVADFPRELFVRKEWDRDGQLAPGEDGFFAGDQEVTLAELAESLGTASMVTRWREANQELANTDQDCVEMTMRAVAKAMSLEAENLCDIRLRVGNSTTLLLLTKR